MVGNGLKQNNLNASFNLKPFKFLTMEYRTRLLHKEVDGSGTEGVSCWMLAPGTYRRIG